MYIQQYAVNAATHWITFKTGDWGNFLPICILRAERQRGGKPSQCRLREGVGACGQVVASEVAVLSTGDGLVTYDMQSVHSSVVEVVKALQVG